VAPKLAASPLPRDLRVHNGVGGFSPDGREYVMSIGPGSRTPAPWCNVLSNAHFGSVVSESGLGFSWSGNSQRERLSPWSNDAVCDASGELVYVRDEEDGRSWSATPAPASLGVDFTVRHGQGYTTYTHSQSEIEHELCVFVSPEDPVKLLRLRLRNGSSRARRLAVYGVVEWVLGAAREATRLQVCTRWDAAHNALLANNPFASSAEARAFLSVNAPVASVSGDREEFFGKAGTLVRPAALERTALSDKTGVGLDPCGALQVLVELAPGETRELCFALGHAESEARALELAANYAVVAKARATYEALGPTWDSILSITAETPDENFDLIVNRWLLYQVVGARLWARSGFYQSSGGYDTRALSWLASTSCERRHASSWRVTCSTGGTPRRAKACARTARTICCGCLTPSPSTCVRPEITPCSTRSCRSSRSAPCDRTRTTCSHHRRSAQSQRRSTSTASARWCAAPRPAPTVCLSWAPATGTTA
jgi:cellobiose phosphorylase